MKHTLLHRGLSAALTGVLCLCMAVPALAATPDQFDPDANYMLSMQECCMSGDFAEGEELERLRNLKIEQMGMSEPQIAFSDLFLLSKLIASEAGSSWLSLDWKMAVGEVLLNRVSSPEFPDTIESCVYAPGQYSAVSAGIFPFILPDESSVIAAAHLLSGERVLNDDSVVFQSNFKQGEVFLVLHDDYLGDTYLCKSSHPECYTQS